MDFEVIVQFVHIAFAIGIFVACFVGGAKHKFRAVEGAWVAFMSLGLIAFGAGFQFIASLTGDREWPGLGPFLLMQRGTIWHGTTFVAVGYGLLAYSVVRVLGMLRKGDG